MRRIISFAVIAAALFLISSTSSFAASRVWIAECNSLGATNSNGVPAQICMLPFIVDSGPLDATSLQTVVTNTKTKIVRVCAEAQTAFKGASGATTSNSVILAGQCEYFGVIPGSTVSAIVEP